MRIHQTILSYIECSFGFQRVAFFNKLSRSASAERAIELSEEVSFGTHLIASDTARHIKTRFVKSRFLPFLGPDDPFAQPLSIFNLADLTTVQCVSRLMAKLGLPCGHHSTIVWAEDPVSQQPTPTTRLATAAWLKQLLRVARKFTMLNSRYLL